MRRKLVIPWFVLFTLLVACTTAVPTNPAPSSTPAAMAVSVSTDPTPTSSPPPTATNPPPTGTPLPPTATPQPPTPTPQPSIEEINATPIFTGGDLQIVGWSPNGRYLAYFEYTEEQVAQSPVPGLRGTVPGTFTIYDAKTGEKCQAYPLDASFPHEGPGPGRRFVWLPDGDLLVAVGGRVIRTERPCGVEADVTSIFPAGFGSFLSFSPDQSRLLVSGAAYQIVDLAAETAVTIPEITVDDFNNLVWAPDGAHIAVTLAGNYTSDRSPIGGTRVVDAVAGDIVARYDWEPVNALDGTFGGPEWISNTEFVVTLSLDQGPFFMTVDGAVRPLLPLFDLTFRRDEILPLADVYAAPAGAYHILLTDFGWTEERMQPQIYHSDTDSVEILPLEPGSYLYIENSLLVQDNRVRPVTAVGAPFEPLTPCAWAAASGLPVYADASGRRVTLHALPSCDILRHFAVPRPGAGAFQVYVTPSPDGSLLAISVHEFEYGLGKALYVVPLETAVPAMPSAQNNLPGRITAVTECQLPQDSRTWGETLGPLPSPDGAHTLTVRNDEGDARIQITQPDGRVQVIDAPDKNIPILAAAWSPDGARLAFANSYLSQPGGGRIFVADADGTAVTPLTDYTGYDDTLAWSPDGRFLAYSSGQAQGQGSGTQVVDYQIFVVNVADGGKAAAVMPGCRPTWQP